MVKKCNEKNWQPKKAAELLKNKSTALLGEKEGGII